MANESPIGVGSESESGSRKSIDTDSDSDSDPEGILTGNTPEKRVAGVSRVEDSGSPPVWVCYN